VRKRAPDPPLRALRRGANPAAGRDAALDGGLADRPDQEPLEVWARRTLQPWGRDSQKTGWTFFFEAQ
jgi:hypothetical protein